MEIVDIPSSHVIVNCVSCIVDCFDLTRCSADQNVYNNLRVIVDLIPAVIDCRVNILIHDCPSVHEEADAFPIVWSKHKWNGRRGKGSVRQVFEIDVVIVELKGFACVHIHCSD